MPVAADPYDPWISQSLPEHLDHLVEGWERYRDVVFENVALAQYAFADALPERPYVLSKQEKRRLSRLILRGDKNSWGSRVKIQPN